MPPFPLATAFLREAPDAAGGRDLAALERDIRELMETARAALPSVSVEEAAFAGYLAPRAEKRFPPTERAADLWLACACAGGSEEATKVLLARHRANIRRAAAQVEPSVADDSTQVTLASLLVREGEGPARIGAYGGESSLSTWLATVAARAAIKLCRRKDQRPHESLAGLARAATDDDPELALLRSKYAPELDAALRSAIAALDARSRLLLRLHHADAWSLEELASLYEVSRATSARWLAAARKEIYDETKRRLREQLTVTSGEFASIVAILEPELAVSVLRLLGQVDRERFP